ncbi:hypothetical protein [Rubrivivax sp. JA1026]|uniref:hypothetical protein n=1 Tax=Rubrivivax sp. JA1026 TaxID=2710888 RepID=UPI0013E913E5|nr:hypothetical protein [Rubrivivax sp. JA1026]
MDRLSASLRQCAECGDWDALAAADAATAALLRGRPAAGVGDAAALSRLRAAHAHAQRRCAEATAAAGQRLLEVARRRDAARGYAALDAGEEA